MALTKADMAESLFNELGLNKREARELVDSFFDAQARCGRSLCLSVRLGFVFGLGHVGSVAPAVQASMRTGSPMRQYSVPLRDRNPSHTR